MRRRINSQPSSPDAPAYPTVTRWASAARRPTSQSDSPAARDVSYSSVALRHSNSSTDRRSTLTPSLSLPPPHTNLRPTAQRTHSLHTSPPRESIQRQATLKRSDSLLQRARRVFSLPASMRRRTRDFAPPPDNLHRRPRTSSAAADRFENLAAADYIPRHRNSFTAAARRVTERYRRKDSLHEDPRPTPAELTEAQHRISSLENELELERVRSSRARRRVRELEQQTVTCRHAIPAVESIIKSALAQFDAKEAALRHTITRMDQEYAALLSEKKEAVRLLNAFVGRGTRSPPPSSFSSVSDGSEGARERRALSLDAIRRAKASSAEA
eukprot:gb/GEZJ01002420.1/.p1 GENE.gb/GEZJ01002420.1/~~gb/GEZJ01002420.1/.p1  ORF type:complete len:379 (-),score=60.93 gb/GEZJ01002420.1/:290-1273(-)